MASTRWLVNVCRRCPVAFRRMVSAPRLRVPLIGHSFAKKSSGLSILTSSAFYTFCQAKQLMDEDALTHEDVLKAASTVTADTVTTLLTQTAFSLIETRLDYIMSVTRLMEYLEYHVTVLGNKDAEENALSSIDEIRNCIENCKDKIEELEILMLNVQDLADASAEVAYLAKAEFIGMTVGERVYHATSHVDIARGKSRQIEEELQKVEAMYTQAIAKHAEKEKRLEDELFGGDFSDETQDGTQERDVFGEDCEKEHSQETAGETDLYDISLRKERNEEAQTVPTFSI